MAVHPALLIALERAAGSLALFVLLAATGCGQVLGADEYGFAEPCPKGAARDSAGACVFRNECGPLEVPDLAEGTCVAVGVPAEECGGGFRSDDGGCRAQVPQAECPRRTITYPGVNGCVDPTIACNPTGFQSTTVTPAVYVSEGTGIGADGSQEKPYSTIAEGLAHLADGGAILLSGPGTYREDLVISTSDVEIIGCSSSVTIEGTGNPTDDAYPCPVTKKDPADPANAGSAVKATVCVAPGTRGVKLHGLTITGPGDGVFVAGATLELSNSGVESVGHYGIRVEETETPTGPKSFASLTAVNVRVHQATGVGVYGAGASVDLTGVYIDRTRQPLFGGEARGISVRPSGEIAVFRVAGSNGSDAPATGPTRPKLKIRSSLISGHSEAGVWISGAESAEIETTFIGSLDPATPSGVGIVVEQSLPSGSPATATIRQCEIARASDAGIDVYNADAIIERTTIRDTWPRTSDRCSGQGVRVRQDPGEQADVTIRQSLIDQSRLSAVYVLNGSARVEQSILRGSAPRDVPEACAPAFGDGLTVESVGDLRAPVVLEHSLVTENARAGAYSAFSDLRINSSLLLSCGPHVVTGLGSIHAETALCGCGESLAACRIETAPLETWLARPGEGIWSDNTMPFENCAWSGGVFETMPRLRVWIADRPEVPATIAGEGGCLRLEGVPASGDLRAELWLHGWNAVAVDVTAPFFPGGFGGVKLEQIEGLQGPTDLNRGMVLIIVPIPRDAGEIPKGMTLESNRGKLYYFGPSGGRDPKLKELSASGIAVITNLEPGWLTLTLKPPVGTACVLEKPIWGLRVPDQPLSLRTRVEPGVLSVLQFNCR